MLKTELLQDKATLIQKRAELKKKDFTECRLLHRTVTGMDNQGKEVTYKYQITYYTGNLSTEDLVLMGFRKAKKKTNK